MFKNTWIRIGVISAIFAQIVQRYFRQQEQLPIEQNSRSQVIDTALGKIEIAVVGDGSPVLVIHGTSGGYDQGLAQSQPLIDAGFKVIAVSRAGYLRTPLSTGETPDVLANVYAALLDELDLKQVAVLAISGGGHSALNFALHHADRCQALVMLSAVSQSLTIPTFSMAGLTKRMLDQPFLTWLVTRTILLLIPIMRWLSPTLRETQLDGAHREAIIRGTLNTMIPVERRIAGIRNDSRQMAVFSDLPLETITVPTLIVHGKEDEVVPFAHAVNTNHIPNSQLMGIDGGGHTSLVTHYDEVWQPVIAFLGEKV